MRRRARLLLVLAVALAGAGIAAGGVLPEGFASVSDVASEPGHYAGREVHLKATIEPGSLQRGYPVRFNVTDGLASLPVAYAGSVPEMFAEGRTVVLTGSLDARGAGPVLVATGIQGGCASKYEPAAQGSP